MNRPEPNRKLTAWLDAQCDKIAQAESGVKRYHTYRGAVNDVTTTIAPLTGGMDEHGFWCDSDEQIMCLQALYWAALAAGVKQQTADRVYTGGLSFV